MRYRRATHTGAHAASANQQLSTAASLTEPPLPCTPQLLADALSCLSREELSSSGELHSWATALAVLASQALRCKSSSVAKLLASLGVYERLAQVLVTTGKQQGGGVGVPAGVPARSGCGAFWWQG